MADGARRLMALRLLPRPRVSLPSAALLGDERTQQAVQPAVPPAAAVATCRTPRRERSPPVSIHPGDSSPPSRRQACARLWRRECMRSMRGRAAARDARGISRSCMQVRAASGLGRSSTLERPGPKPVCGSGSGLVASATRPARQRAAGCGLLQRQRAGLPAVAWSLGVLEAWVAMVARRRPSASGNDERQGLLGSVDQHSREHMTPRSHSQIRRYADSVRPWPRRAHLASRSSMMTKMNGATGTAGLETFSALISSSQPADGRVVWCIGTCQASCHRQEPDALVLP